MLKLWDIVLVFVSNEITVEHPLISAQPTTTNTVEYITSPAKQHIPQRRTAAWPGGVEHGLRNYECFPSSQLPHAKCSRRKEIYLPHAKYSRWKGNPPYVEMLHPGRESATCEMLHPGKGFTSRKFHAKIKK